MSLYNAMKCFRVPSAMTRKLVSKSYTTNRCCSVHSPQNQCHGQSAIGSTGRICRINTSEHRSSFALSNNVLNQSRSLHTSNQSRKIEDFLLADIGEGIQEVIVKEWFVSVGDKVHQFDNVCEVQSDKASVTITSRYDGIVSKIHYDVDETAFVGKPLMSIEVPKDAAGMSGDSNAVGAEVPEQESIDVAQSVAAKEEEVLLPKANVICIPAVRRLAKENKIDLSQILGTGKDGRILKEDVLNYMAKGKPSLASRTPPPPAAAAPPTPVQAPLPSTPAPTPAKVLPSSLPLSLGADRTEPIRGMQKTMVKTMTEAMKIPHFGYCDELDLTQLVALKPGMKKIAALYDVKMSLMPFFIKAASVALTQFPILNSCVDDKCENITYKASHNIGLAMDTPMGLLVPNIKGVQNLTVLEVAKEINRLQEAGSKGLLKATDLSGGTFTLSNIGSIGGTYAKPVILPPSVVIGALGKIQKVPRFDSQDRVIAAHILNVSWSADHRVIDGATMARFSNLWRDMLETPSMLTLNMK